MYLSLGGIHIANNSNVSFYGIGEGDGEALLCVTDLMQCCHRKNTATGRALGWWFYPDGSDVPTYVYHNIYRDRGRNIVRLNHRNHTHVEPTGLYCCEVPDSTFTAQRLCANIGESVHNPVCLLSGTHSRKCFVSCTQCMIFLGLRHLLVVYPVLQLRLVSWNPSQYTL